MNPLIFIDTNILLDFYRIRRSDVSLKLLKRVDDHHAEIITGSQVEMEFKRNRQNVIVGQLTDLQKNASGAGSLPAILSETQCGKTYSKKLKDVGQHEKKIRQKIEKILYGPTHNDPVYRCFQRLFKANTIYNLNELNDRRHQIRSLARNRFFLGYPPRKQNDTSMGDAVNWEWMVHCCQAAGRDLVIVSRDSDYGISYQKEMYLNDWLKQEFKNRVGMRKNAVLTDKLTVAFKYWKVPVTKSEADEEEYLVESFSSAASIFPSSVINWVSAHQNIDESTSLWLRNFLSHSKDKSDRQETIDSLPR